MQDITLDTYATGKIPTIKSCSYGVFHLRTINPSPISSYDICLTKRRADGTVAWSKVFGTSSYYEMAIDIDVCESDGLIYVLGYSTNIGAYTTALLYVVDQSGAIIATKYLGASGTAYSASRIVVTESTIFVTGYVSGRATVHSIARLTLVNTGARIAQTASVPSIPIVAADHSTDSLIALTANSTLVRSAKTHYVFNSSATLVYRSVVALTNSENTQPTYNGIHQFGSDVIFLLSTNSQSSTGVNYRGLYLIKRSGATHTLLLGIGFPALPNTGETVAVISSTLVGDKLFMLLKDIGGGGKARSLYCVSLATNEILWKYTIGVGASDTIYSLATDGTYFHILWLDSAAQLIKYTVYADIDDLVSDPRITVESTYSDSTAYGFLASTTGSSETWSAQTFSINTVAVNSVSGPYPTDSLILAKLSGYLGGG